VMTKKEQLVLSRERIKLDRTLGGIRDMARVPSAIWVVDTKKEHIAVGEARKLGIPVVAVLDTNCDPDEVDYKIPGNDDAIRSAALLTRVIADAVAEGKLARAAAQANAGRDEESGDGAVQPAEIGANEPMPEWERELLEGKSTAAATVGTAASDAADAVTAAPAAPIPADGTPSVQTPEATADASAPPAPADAAAPEAPADAPDVPDAPADAPDAPDAPAVPAVPDAPADAPAATEAATEQQADAPPAEDTTERS